MADKTSAHASSSPVPSDTSPAPLDTSPAPLDTSPVPATPGAVPSGTGPVTTDTAGAKAEAKRAKAEAKRAKTDGKRAKAEARRAKAGGPAVAKVAHPALRLWAGSFAFLGLLVATYAAFVLTEPGQRLENLGLEGSALRAGAARAEFTFGLSAISVVSFAIAIAAVGVVALLRRRPALAVAAVTAMGGSAVLGSLLKDVLPRPELLEGPAWLLRNSFPSGHATVAAAVGAGILMVVPGRLRWAALPIAAVGAAVIGQATQIAGWHRASDAIGSMLLVLAVAAAALAMLAAAGYVEPDPRGRVHPRIQVGLFAVALLLLVTAGLMGLLPFLFPLLRAPTGAEGVFVHLGLGLAGAGLTLLAFAGFGRLQEPLVIGRRPERAPSRRPASAQAGVPADAAAGPASAPTAPAAAPTGEPAAPAASETIPTPAPDDHRASP